MDRSQPVHTRPVPNISNKKILHLSMPDQNNILQLIKSSVQTNAPGATVLLYGSYARGDNRSNSDIDILILIDKNKITSEDIKRVAYPLYEIEFETGKIISPLILSKQNWDTKHRITPFYKNVRREGVVL